MTVPDDIAARLAVAARKAADAEEWRQRRNRLVVAALAAGGTQPEVAKLAGLTQAAVSKILTRHYDEEADDGR